MRRGTRFIPLILLATIGTSLIIFSFVGNFSNITGQYHFSSLAHSFLQGTTSFLERPDDTWEDTAFFHGKFFWPLGPFPALLLVPFVSIGKGMGFFFREGYLNFFIVMGVALLGFWCARASGYPREDASYWTLAFCGGTVFLAPFLIPNAWLMAQSITVCVLFLALWEWMHRRRFWYLGVLGAVLLTTRFTAGIGMIFFVLEVLTDPALQVRERWTRVVQLALPMGVSLVVLGIYNVVRFGTPLEQGYLLQILQEPLLVARSYGLFDLIHVPGNLFYAFFRGPMPVFRDGVSHVLAYPFVKADPWGMGLFFTSPFLLTLFFFSYRDRIAQLLLVTAGMVAVPLFLYYGIGYQQLGYRYALDFLPFLFLLILREYRSQRHETLSLGLRIVILVSVVVNFYFLSTVYFVS